MNYGRKSTAKKEKELLSKGTMIRKKFTVIFAKTLLVCLIAFTVVGGCAGYGVYKGIVDSAPNIHDIDATPTGYLSTVLDNQGNETATLVASGSNRVYVTIDEIPLDLQHAFVAIEDARFYEHNGIDITGIVRAGITGITSGRFSQGASTITQQLLKNNVFTDWTSESSFADKMERKIQEQYLAIQLEKVEDKDWILENYLNTINLGQNTLGVQAASQRYFNKDVSELTLSECAVIAGITQNPSRYNPVSNPDANAERRTKVLNNMLDQGYIDQAAYDTAMADNVYDRIQIVDSETASDNINSYFVDALTEQVIDDLMEVKGYTETQAYKALYEGGLTIYSTQDPSIQQICDEEVNNADNYGSETKYSCSYRLTIQKADGTYQNYSEQTMLSYYQSKNSKYNIDFDSKEAVDAAIEQYKADIMEDGDTIVPNGESITYTMQPQASMTVIDQSTGEVKAIVGGRGDKTANKTLNRATDTKRQPGSTFKILSAYAPALDIGGMTLASVQDDAPYTYSNATHTPVNNYDKSYRGFTTIREGITYSINIVAVKTLTDIGVDIGYEYLQNFGFSTLCDSDRTQALALGGITNGVTNLELTAAYATIANGGTYTKPRFYTKILDHDGNVLIDNTPQTHTVLKETTAWLLTNAMEDVLTNGTGRPAHFNGMPQAGKSGTTSSDRDALFAGYTPYYTCVVWGGYDDNAELSYTTYPKTLWKSVMGRIHENLDYKDFDKPDGITTATVCKKSGKLAVAGLCDSDPRGSMVESEYFASGTVPKDYCDHHVRVTIDLSTGGIATDTCPEELRSSNVYITGGSAGTQDAPYLLTDDLANSLNAAGSEDPNAPTTGGAGDASTDAGTAAPAGDTPAAETPAETPQETPQDVQPEQQAADPAAQ
ncbi:transglycosylase domain-containing protein [Roseburia yibonii]|uniref:transglycosylase domain-containing protein n=1 Tax=Roseburia yibonii TaxID=2763063 RepID=UPI001FACF869|nr:PBP1A family penicillin-binding protein [Roseburia yibonii]